MVDFINGLQRGGALQNVQFPVDSPREFVTLGKIRHRTNRPLHVSNRNSTLRFQE
jgi:hypothetical protein